MMASGSSPGRQILPTPKAERLPPRGDVPDMADFAGRNARRVLEIAAAGSTC